jgi:hypothetical protein
MLVAVVIIISYGATHETVCPPQHQAPCQIEIFNVVNYPVFLGIVTYALQAVTTVLFLKSFIVTP